MKKQKTKTGALPNSAGFPGRDMVKDSWMESMVKQTLEKYRADAERLFYTAPEGSLLDRIWKGEDVFGVAAENRNKAKGKPLKKMKSKRDITIDFKMISPPKDDHKYWE